MTAAVHTRPAGDLQVGQLVMIGFAGLSPPEYALRWLREGRVGGFFVFGPNVGDRGQLRALIAEVKAAAPGPAPIVAMDMEGGRVQLWGPPHFAAQPGARELGEGLARGDAEAGVRRVGEVIGRELRALGVDVNFAPVLDVDSCASNPIIGSRSFGADARLVDRGAAAFIAGLEGAGVVACGKHFPGHGDTDRDSHVDLPVVDADDETLRRRELEPFRRAVARGLGAIMTAHVRYPAWDPERPATTSGAIIEGVLRGELGFEGVVFTDDMAMKGIRQRDDLLGASLAALGAGCDVVLTATEYGEHGALIEGLEEAARDGGLARRRIARSLGRLGTLRRRIAAAQAAGRDRAPA